MSSNGLLPRDDNGAAAEGGYESSISQVAPVQLDASGNLKTAPQQGGSPISLANPTITEEQIRAYIAAGQGFSAYINGSIAAASAAGISLFADNLAKTLVFYRITAGSATAGSNCKLATKTTDFALGAGAAIATNFNTGSVITSLATLSSSITATSAGTIIDYTLLPAFIATEILENNEVVIIPAGTVMAFAAFMDCVGTTGQGFISVSWLEI